VLDHCFHHEIFRYLHAGSLNALKNAEKQSGIPGAASHNSGLEESFDRPRPEGISIETLWPVWQIVLKELRHRKRGAKLRESDEILLRPFGRRTENHQLILQGEVHQF